jgi:hypothetical protein
LAGKVNGPVADFAWVNPEPEDGDTYRWRVIDALGDPIGDTSQATEAKVSVPLEGEDTVCIEVVIVRTGGTGSVKPAKACAEAAEGAVP